MQLEALRPSIIAHPWRSLAIAFVGGAVLAIADQLRPHGRSSLMLTLLGDLAVGRARSWIDDRQRPFAETS